MRTIVDRFSHDLLGSARRRDLRGTLIAVVDVLTFLMAMVAAAALVARYGFFLDAALRSLADRVGRVVLYVFLVQAGIKILLTRDRIGYLRSHVAEMILISILLLILLFPGRIGAALKAWNPLLAPASLANLYVAVTQVSLLLAFLPAGLRASRRLMSAPVQPALLIVLSFALLILAGTGVLLLPRATATGRLSFIDALFTATSAGCVTGLAVVDTASTYAPLGRFAILLLMQAGGLGIMTLTTFFAGLVARRGSLKEYATLQAILGEDSIRGIRGAAVQIAVTTLALELVGATFLYVFIGEGTFASDGERLFFAVFHAVSAFCNAGFSLLSEGLAAPLFRDNPALLCTTMVLIVTGGLGFSVMRNLVLAMDPRGRARRRRRLSLHTRLVLFVTIALIVMGAVGFGLLESRNTLRGEDSAGLVLHALFQSVTARTAGFHTVSIGALTAPTAILVMLLMWIGASPGSTGGGIKTTAFALLVLDVRSVARGKDRVELFRARVDSASLSRAHATALLSFLFIGAGFFTLAVLERQPLLSLLFESVSAAATVGLSTGITPSFSTAGKAVVILLMFVGRVGFLTLAMALTPQARVARVDYAAENVPVL